MKTDIVSIIVVSFNSSKYIYDALNSVLIQTYPLIELIVADDNSSDNTVDLVNAYSGR